MTQSDRIVVSGPSSLSLIAAALYAVVVLACLAATFSAVAYRQVPAHWRSWAALAILFCVLIVLRVLNLEPIWRDDLRAFLVATDSYDDRRGLQGILVLGIAALAGIAAFFWIFRRVRSLRGRRNFAVIAAQTAGMAMVALVALRTVSFSALDKLLFGPLKLNWITDLGASAVIAGTAAYYVWIVTMDARVRTRGPAR